MSICDVWKYFIEINVLSACKQIINVTNKNNLLQCGKTVMKYNINWWQNLIGRFYKMFVSCHKYIALSFLIFH